MSYLRLFPGGDGYREYSQEQLSEAISAARVKGGRVVRVVDEVTVR